MELSEIQAAIGGPTNVPKQPEGGSDAPVLNPLGLDRVGGEPAPANVSAAQGAGSGPGGLYPSPGEPADGTVQKGWKGAAYAAQDGPAMLEPSQGLSALTPDPSHGRPAGSAPPAGEDVGRPDYALGLDQSVGQGINPALKAALQPRPGPFGSPSST